MNKEKHSNISAVSKFSVRVTLKQNLLEEFGLKITTYPSYLNLESDYMYINNSL